MSPTVPPTSTMTTSAPLLSPTPRMRSLISLVTWGIDLDGAAQVIAPPLLGDDRLVDLAGGDVAGPGQVLVDEALVVAQVEVGLGAVVGDEHLAVLVGRHGAGVDVEVGVELLDRRRGCRGP